MQPEEQWVRQGLARMLHRVPPREQPPERAAGLKLLQLRELVREPRQRGCSGEESASAPALSAQARTAAPHLLLVHWLAMRGQQSALQVVAKLGVAQSW
jgi:hypothetical protein